MRRPLVIYDFAPNPFFSFYMRNFFFFFISVQVQEEHVVKTVIISPDIFQRSYTANVNNEERKLTNDKKKVI